MWQAIPLKVSSAATFPYAQSRNKRCFEDGAEFILMFLRISGNAVICFFLNMVISFKRLFVF